MPTRQELLLRELANQRGNADLASLYGTPDGSIAPELSFGLSGYNAYADQGAGLPLSGQTMAGTQYGFAVPDNPETVFGYAKDGGPYGVVFTDRERTELEGDFRDRFAQGASRVAAVVGGGAALGATGSGPVFGGGAAAVPASASAAPATAAPAASTVGSTAAPAAAGAGAAATPAAASAPTAAGPAASPAASGGSSSGGIFRNLLRGFGGGGGGGRSRPERPSGLPFVDRSPPEPAFLPINRPRTRQQMLADAIENHNRGYA